MVMHKGRRSSGCYCPKKRNAVNAARVSTLCKPSKPNQTRRKVDKKRREGEENTTKCLNANQKSTFFVRSFVFIEMIPSHLVHVFVVNGLNFFKPTFRL